MGKTVDKIMRAMETYKKRGDNNKRRKMKICPNCGDKHYEIEYGKYCSLRCKNSTKGE